MFHRRSKKSFKRGGMKKHSRRRGKRIKKNMVYLEEASVYDMQCTNPVRISKNLDRVKFPDGLLVPCGKCLSCRIAKKIGMGNENDT